MQNNSDDTIAAISTPAGEGGVGMIRVSGKDALKAVDQIFRSKRGISLKKVKTHTIHYGHVVDSENQIIDEVLVSVFHAPNSYTAETVVEINAHGGFISLKQTLNSVLKQGVRMAEPGEFTKRAFLNGRIDLAQAEAVIDTIRAKTDLALKAAVSQLQGSVSRDIHSIKDDIMKIYAHMEAYLDFPDEHLEIYSNDEFRARYDLALKKVEALLQSFAKGEILREGLLMVLVGRPNVGKSSLLNALLERDRALVSEIPGTTRDALEEMIELEGIPIRIVDTAGLFSSKDSLTQASMEKTRKYLSEGDIFLFILDAKDGFMKEDEIILNELSGKNVIPVVNKIDLIQNASANFKIEKKSFASEPCFISAKEKMGINDLEEKMISLATTGKVTAESNRLTRFRHKQVLEEALASLRQSREAFLAKTSLELVIFDLKRSLDALREVVGEVYSEDLLEVVFKEFCIGK